MYTMWEQLMCVWLSKPRCAPPLTCKIPTTTIIFTPVFPTFSTTARALVVVTDNRFCNSVDRSFRIYLSTWFPSFRFYWCFGSFDDHLTFANTFLSDRIQSSLPVTHICFHYEQSLFIYIYILQMYNCILTICIIESIIYK